MSPSHNAHMLAVRSGIATVMTVGLLATAAIEPANAAAVHLDSAQSSTPTSSWATVDESVHADPADVATKVDRNDRARVVAVTEVDGAPVFDVTDVKGNAQARAVVQQKQEVSGTLAVAVQEKQQLTASTSDPYSGSQWALSKLKTEAVWPSSQGAQQMVAVVDTGTSPEPDLTDNLLTGWDFINQRADGRIDQNGHGTHVAGAIAAVANNNIGGAGLAPKTKVLPVRVLDATGSGYWSDVANGIVYAVDQGAGVINLSLGGHIGDPSLETAIKYARSNGRVVVAAVGNDGTNTLTYPAAYPGVIGVAASDESDQVADFSNFGSAVDVTAPGVGILSTVPGGYASYSGTSMATPFVSATAALLRSAAVTRGSGEVDVESVLRATATDIGAPGVDARAGAGLINPSVALGKLVRVAPRPVSVRVSVNRKNLTVRLNETGIHEVVLQRKSGKKWRRSAVRTTSDAGLVKFRILRGSTYRVLVTATALTAPVTSKPVRSSRR